MYHANEIGGWLTNCPILFIPPSPSEKKERLDLELQQLFGLGWVMFRVEVRFRVRFRVI